MAPSEYLIRLQHGIAGGFAPPTPSAVHMISLALDTPGTVTINSQLRPVGTADLGEAAPKTLAASEAAPLVDELEAILKDLPVERPPGSEDIYGMDTSIMFGSASLEWVNASGQGCMPGASQVQATEAQKTQFKRAIEIVNQLVAK